MPRISALQIADHGAQVIAYAIAADQDFKVINALCLHTAHRIGQR